MDRVQRKVLWGGRTNFGLIEFVQPKYMSHKNRLAIDQRQNECTAVVADPFRAVYQMSRADVYSLYLDSPEYIASRAHNMRQDDYGSGTAGVTRLGKE